MDKSLSQTKRALKQAATMPTQPSERYRSRKYIWEQLGGMSVDEQEHYIVKILTASNERSEQKCATVYKAVADWLLNQMSQRNPYARALLFDLSQSNKYLYDDLMKAIKSSRMEQEETHAGYY